MSGVIDYIQLLPLSTAGNFIMLLEGLSKQVDTFWSLVLSIFMATVLITPPITAFCIGCVIMFINGIRLVLLLAWLLARNTQFFVGLISPVPVRLIIKKSLLMSIMKISACAGSLLGYLILFDFLFSRQQILLTAFAGYLFMLCTMTVNFLWNDRNDQIIT